MPESTAIIIGSGFNDFADGDAIETASNKFGQPSAPIKQSRIAGKDILSIARHGDAHTLPPHAINYRANLAALRDVGTERIVAVNTVGVVSAVRESGQLAVPKQLTDYTWGRLHTIYDGSDGLVDHIDFTEPFSEPMRMGLLNAAAHCDIDCYDGGVYATTQGPRLETAAEVDRFEREGADFLGMTAMPEAAIARELGMDYVCLALIVNRAAGRGTLAIHDDLEANISRAVNDAKTVLHEYLGKL